MNLNHLMISTRLRLGFAAVLVLTVAMAAVGLTELHRIASFDATLDKLAMRIQLVERWHGQTQVNLARAIAVAQAGHAESVAAPLKAQMKATSATIDGLHKQVEAMLETEGERALLARIGEKRQAYLEVRERVAALHGSGQPDAARQLFESTMMPAVAAYEASIGELIRHDEAATEVAAAAFDTELAAGRTWLVGTALLSLVCGAAFAWSLTRSITAPLRQAVGVADAMAVGDLTQRIDTGRRDEIGQLLQALARTQAGLSTMVSQVRHATDSIDTASREIASGNSDLSSRTEQAAGNLQSTASALEQYSSSIAQSADSAQTANQLAGSASSVAQRGGDVVSQVVSTMDEIHASSRRIADIIATIDGIAFQTNILALNAAVEAARAGEQGRGFAVVAGEVRSLAQRSADAAKEIKVLIGTSVDRVETGARLVAEAGTTMHDIVSSVQRVSDIIAEISAAAGEQRAGIVQVSGAVQDLDRMTQQNAALVEQSAAAADSLRQQAGQLSQAVSAFRLDASSTGRHPA